MNSAKNTFIWTIDNFSASNQGVSESYSKWFSTFAPSGKKLHWNVEIFPNGHYDQSSAGYVFIDAELSNPENEEGCATCQFAVRNSDGVDSIKKATIARDLHQVNEAIEKNENIKDEIKPFVEKLAKSDKAELEKILINFHELPTLVQTFIPIARNECEKKMRMLPNELRKHMMGRFDPTHHRNTQAFGLVSEEAEEQLTFDCEAEYLLLFGGHLVKQNEHKFAAENEQIIGHLTKKYKEMKGKFLEFLRTMLRKYNIEELPQKYAKLEKETFEQHLLEVEAMIGKKSA